MSLINSVVAIFSHFNALDYCFVAMMVIAMLAGGMKGFCRQIVSWFFWIVTGYVVYFYAGQIADNMLKQSISTPFLRVLVVDAIIVVSAMIMSFVINRLMQGVLAVTGMSVFDRFLGVYFGMMQGVVLIAVIVTGFTSTSVKHESWWRDSRVVVMTTALMPVYADDLGQFIEYSLKNLNLLWMQSVGDQFSWGDQRK